MKPIKKYLRYWFAVTSVLSFVGGWIILAHSPKPVPPTKTTNLAPLQALPSIQTFGTTNNNNNGFDLFSTGPQNNNQSGSGFGFPVMRTGGS